MPCLMLSFSDCFISNHILIIKGITYTLCILGIIDNNAFYLVIAQRVKWTRWTSGWFPKVSSMSDSKSSIGLSDPDLFNFFFNFRCLSFKCLILSLHCSPENEYFSLDIFSHLFFNGGPHSNSLYISKTSFSAPTDHTELKRLSPTGHCDNLFSFFLD